MQASGTCQFETLLPFETSLGGNSGSHYRHSLLLKLNFPRIESEEQATIYKSSLVRYGTP